MNITDIDDKTLKGAIEKQVPLKEYTEPFTQAFLEDLHDLNIMQADALPKATDYVPHMIRMIETLVLNKNAYEGPDGSVYFSIGSFPSYGKLSNLENKQLVAGASMRVASDEYDKESPSDFVLWKAYDKTRDGDIYWESPFGRGRPGWHIECSAMATDLLGPTLDIHCGGVDNIFPHHENEIAQCEACHHKLFSQFWMHSQHLLVDGKKMSKSLGNFYTLRDLMSRGYSARAIRFVLVSGHYRMPLNFTFEGLEGAKAALNRFDSFVDRLKTQKAALSASELRLDGFKSSLENALLQDLNTPIALSALFDMIRSINAQMDEAELTEAEASMVLKLLAEYDQVFGFIFHKQLPIPKKIVHLAEERRLAKEHKNFKQSDLLRDEIRTLGYLIEDGPSGYRITQL